MGTSDSAITTSDIVREWLISKVGGREELVHICQEAVPDSMTIELGEDEWVYTPSSSDVRGLVIDCLCDSSKLGRYTDLYGNSERGYEEAIADAAKRLMDEHVNDLYAPVSAHVREVVADSTGLVLDDSVDVRSAVEHLILIHNEDERFGAPSIHDILEDIEVPTIVELRLPVDADSSMWDSYMSLCVCMQIFDGDTDRVRYSDNKLGDCTLSPQEFLRNIDDWLPDSTIEWLCRTQQTTLAEVMERDELGRFTSQGMFANSLRAEIASFGVDHIFPYLWVPCTCTGTELLHLVATSYGGGREVSLTIPAGTRMGLWDPEGDGFCGRLGICLEREVDVPPEMAYGFADVGYGTPSSLVRDLPHDAAVEVRSLGTDIIHGR